jgi:signal transduction histidine kinase
VLLRVEDDGRGPGDIRPGSGLRTMRERAEEIGGTLQVTGIEPHGTAILATLPLHPDRPAP